MVVEAVLEVFLVEGGINFRTSNFLLYFTRFCSGVPKQNRGDMCQVD
jgi:hypothetical protein